jgi:hypothetical protein
LVIDAMEDGSVRNDVRHSDAAKYAHFCMNAKDPPTRKRHVLAGLVTMRGGGYGVNIHPNTTAVARSLSPGIVLAETVNHGIDYARSKIQRGSGDSRAHDKGEFKRKERVSQEDVGVGVRGRVPGPEMVGVIHGSDGGPAAVYICTYVCCICNTYGRIINHIYVYIYIYTFV